MRLHFFVEFPCLLFDPFFQAGSFLPNTVLEKLCHVSLPLSTRQSDYLHHHRMSGRRSGYAWVQRHNGIYPCVDLWASFSLRIAATWRTRQIKYHHLPSWSRMRRQVASRSQEGVLQPPWVYLDKATWKKPHETGANRCYVRVRSWSGRYYSKNGNITSS